LPVGLGDLLLIPLSHDIGLARDVLSLTVARKTVTRPNRRGADGIGEVIFFHAVAERARSRLEPGHSSGDPDKLRQAFRRYSFALHGESGNKEVVADEVDDTRNAARTLVNFFEQLGEKIV